MKGSSVMIGGREPVGLGRRSGCRVDGEGGEDGVAILGEAKNFLIGSLVLGASLFSKATTAAAQQCSPSRLLPAYSHNDYNNVRPLEDALALGYQGVEVDYVLVGRELLVGHGRGEVMPGRSLERLYLAPLRERVRRCGWVQSAERPFLLTIDYKDQGRWGYRALHELLEKYTDVVGATGNPRAVQVVLVGWHPPLRELARDPVKLVTVQAHISRSGLRIPGDTNLVGLVSLDYGKTMRWRGRGALSKDDQRVLQHITAARAALPNRLIRAYNVPPEPGVYRLLLRSGVDLIGIKGLSRAYPPEPGRGD
jgi:hypothetical protein